jgi:hypothetical protein
VYLHASPHKGTWSGKNLLSQGATVIMLLV